MDLVTQDTGSREKAKLSSSSLLEVRTEGQRQSLIVGIACWEDISFFSHQPINSVFPVQIYYDNIPLKSILIYVEYSIFTRKDISASSPAPTTAPGGVVIRESEYCRAIVLI